MFLNVESSLIEVIPSTWMFQKKTGNNGFDYGEVHSVDMQQTAIKTPTPSCINPF